MNGRRLVARGALVSTRLLASRFVAGDRFRITRELHDDGAAR
jgi:hypothetical protein